MGFMGFVKFIEPISEYWTLVTMLIDTGQPDSVTVMF